MKNRILSDNMGVRFLKGFGFRFLLKRKLILISFLLSLINGVALLVVGKQLARFSSLPKLDFQVTGYDVNAVLTLFNQYGPEGRNIYWWLTILDTPFPFFVAIFGFSYFTSTWCKWGMKRLGIFFSTASFCFLIFDTLENLIIYKMLYCFPAISLLETVVASLSTQIKLTSLIIVYLAIPATFLVNVYKYLRSKSIA